MIIKYTLILKTKFDKLYVYRIIVAVREEWNNFKRKHVHNKLSSYRRTMASPMYIGHIAACP